MIKDVTIPARLLTCEVCSYEWVSIMRDRVPSHCQNRECRSREWNGKKPKKVPEAKPVLVLPKVHKVRKGDENDEF
jgi:hypothetical protein